MKKFRRCFVVVLIPVLLLGVLLFYFIRYQEIVYGEPTVWYPSIRVFQNDNGFTVYFLEETHISGSMRFSEDLQLLRNWNLEAINAEDAPGFLGKRLDEIVKNYGQPHADIGSGFFYPAYVSKNAQLIVLFIDENNVYKVVVKDLITNTLLVEYNIE